MASIPQPSGSQPLRPPFVGSAGPPQNFGPPMSMQTLNSQPSSTQQSSDWKEHTSAHGKRFYYNKKTRQSSWEKPLELMTPIERADASTIWKEFTTPEGRKYYYNKVTKQSKWTIPDELKRGDALTVWKEFSTPEGRKYYYNKVTKQSKWTIPDELKLAREQAEKATAQAPHSQSETVTASVAPVVVTAPPVEMPSSPAVPSSSTPATVSGIASSPVQVTPVIAAANPPPVVASESLSITVNSSLETSNAVGMSSLNTSITSLPISGSGSDVVTAVTLEATATPTKYGHYRSNFENTPGQNVAHVPAEASAQDSENPSKYADAFGEHFKRLYHEVADDWLNPHSDNCVKETLSDFSLESDCKSRIGLNKCLINEQSSSPHGEREPSVSSGKDLGLASLPDISQDASQTCDNFIEKSIPIPVEAKECDSREKSLGPLKKLLDSGAIGSNVLANGLSTYVVHPSKSTEDEVSERGLMLLGCTSLTESSGVCQTIETMSLIISVGNERKQQSKTNASDVFLPLPEIGNLDHLTKEANDDPDAVDSKAEPIEDFERILRISNLKISGMILILKRMNSP